MKYKGFEIVPVYHVGSDFTVKNGTIRDRKPTSKDIAYYSILDPMNNDRQHCAENTTKECKKSIDDLLVLLGMKDNTIIVG